MNIGSLLSRQTTSFASPALRQITLEVAKVNGVNLGQGVCNLPVPELVRHAAHEAVEAGINRYTNPRGLPSLRNALAEKLRRHNGIMANPETEVLVTCGATGAFEAVCAVLLDPGDEVVIFEPSYPYHVQALRRYQAEVTYLPLHAPDWQIDFDQVRAAIGTRTKFLLLNTPGNPTGRVWTREELLQLAAILEPTNCLLVTDEIYEYMTFDGRPHLSPGSMPELASRTITIGGYSKTFSITGWRVGFAVVPADLGGIMASLLDAVYVCSPAPLQEAVARGIATFDDAFYTDLAAEHQAKRDLFARGLRDVGLTPLVPQGSYYMICSYEDAFPGMDSGEFVRQMIATAGVGAVPSADFVRNPSAAPWVRFCLAHEDAVLHDALDRLRARQQ